MTHTFRKLSTFFKEKQNIFIPIFLMLVGLIIYANCFPNEMFWDDDDFILKNRYIKDWQYLPKYFTENVVSGNYLLSNYWRPVLLMVFSAQWHLWKDWAPGWHILSVLLHSFDSVLLYFLLYRFFQARYLAMLTSLVFLVHPIQTEAVVYANAISDSLAAFFTFSGLILYHKFKTTSFLDHPSKGIVLYISCLMMYPLGIMSKETGFMLPAYIFLTEFLIINKPAQWERKTVLSFLYVFIPFLIIAAIYLYLRATALNFVNTFNFYNEQNLLTSHFHIRLFTFFKVMTIYAGLLFFPLDLHVERIVSLETSLFSVPVLFGAVICAGLFALAWKHFKKTPLIPLSVLWFFIGIFPSSNLLIPINALLYEHFLYMPLIGIFLIVIHLGFEWSKKLKFQTTLLKLFLVYLILFSGRTMIRNLDWRDSVIFYENLLKYAPESYRVINNLGMMYAQRQLLQKAEETYQRAIRLDPANPVGWHNLGGTYRDTGRADLAFKSFEKALHLDPKFLFSYKSLAQLYLDANNFQRARDILEQYLIYTPEKIETLTLLSQIALRQKDLSGARFYLKKALSLDPENTKLQQTLKEVQNLLFDSRPSSFK